MLSLWCHFLFIGKELFKQTLWTAHGVKLLPANVDMSIRKEGKVALPASPPFLEFVDDTALGELTSRLCKIQHNQYEIAECVLRDVRRIPLKPEGVDEIEVKHLSLSSDGLRFSILWHYIPIISNQLLV